MSQTDLQLLDRYAREKSEDAFGELVHRHLNLVFSAALRQVRNAHLAEEVAQSAFIDLARQARGLAPDTVLSAWLYEVTRRKAIDVVRREIRRQAREQIAQELTAMNATENDWTRIEPLLDEGVLALEERDRAIVLLRYFENKSLREVADRLNINEEAARKRVGRAVERLREFFAQRGVTMGAGGLVAAVSCNAVQAAPSGLSVTISTAAVLSGKTIATAASAVGTKAIAMTTLQKGIIGATFATTAALGIYQAREASNWRAQAQVLQQQRIPAAEQIEQLTRERDDLAGQFAVLREENDRLKQTSGEVLKLRGEVGLLKKHLAGIPKPAAEKITPAPPPSEEKAGITPEDEMKNQAIARMNYLKAWVLAFHLYADQNQGQFPTNFDQADPFLPEEAKTEAKLKPSDFLPGIPKYGLTPDRYEITYRGTFEAITNPPQTIVMRENAACQVEDGYWLRTYGFADGHTEVHRAGEGGFESWEAERGLVAK
jgi:RNA polymerase sigma factor (sigma-70 family)